MKIKLLNLQTILMKKVAFGITKPIDL